MRTLLFIPAAALLFGCSDANIGTTSSALSSLSVTFAGCQEVASLAPAPYDNVRPLVPARFKLASGGPGLAIIVVRVANCQHVTVDGKDVGAGTVAQVGPNLVSPDGTGDINNYAFYYSTTSAALAHKLRKLGVPAEHVEDIGFETQFQANGKGKVEVEVEKPEYEVTGDIEKPTAPPVSFTANWWSDDHGQNTRMQTPIATIQFGGAKLTLKTDPDGKLGKLFGTGTVTFPYFDSYNTFVPAATMTTSHVNIP